MRPEQLLEAAMRIRTFEGMLFLWICTYLRRMNLICIWGQSVHHSSQIPVKLWFCSAELQFWQYIQSPILLMLRNYLAGQISLSKAVHAARVQGLLGEDGSLLVALKVNNGYTIEAGSFFLIMIMISCCESKFICTCACSQILRPLIPLVQISVHQPPTRT